MNSIIETWNSWAEHLPGFVWPMLWQSSLLIAAVFALDLALRRRVRAAVRYALWLIVLVKLVLPPSFASPASLAYWVIPTQQLPPAPKPTPTYIVTYGNPTIAELPLPARSVLPVAEPEVFRPTPTLWAWLLIGWTVAGLWLTGILCRRTQRVRQRLTRAEAPADDLSVLLEKCRRQLRVRYPVRLRVSEDNTSPAVCGLFRPVILLPRQLTASLNQSQMRAVLLHELIHLKRGDVWVNCAQTLLQIFYWWHPLLWLANARIRRVREEAVDDAVMLALADDAETYAPTLLEVAKLAFNRPLTSLGLVGILESRSALRQRIERLMDFRPPRKAGLTMASALCVLAFAALAVPMGEPPPIASSPSGSGSGSPHSDTSNPQPATASDDTNTLRIDGARSIGISSNAARPRSSYDRQPGQTIIYSNKVGADGTLERPEPAGQTNTPAKQPPSAVNAGANTGLGSISKGRQNILDKLDRIRLPWVAYDGVAFTNVVRDLIAQTRTLDPAKRGINFIVNPNVDLPSAARIDAATGKPATEPGPPEVLGTLITINPPLTDARLKEVLDAVMKAADKLIQYTIEDYAIVFSLKTQTPPEPLFVRTFKVDTNRLYGGLSALGLLDELPPDEKAGPHRGTPGTHFTHKVSVAVQGFFSSLDVDLNPSLGKSMFWNERAGTLLIRATMKELEAIERALAELLPPTGGSAIEPTNRHRAASVQAELRTASSTNPVVAEAQENLSAVKEIRPLQAELQRGVLADPLQRFPLESLLEPPNSTQSAAGSFGQAKDRVPVLGDIPFLARLLHSESNSPPNAVGTNNPAHSDALYTRTFKVDTKTFLANLRRTAGVTVTNDAELISSTLRKLVSDAGVELQPPQSLYFNSRGILWARATLRDLDRIEEVVQKLNYAPPQIHIKAHFVELEQNDASRLLGFDWYPGNILLRGITATNASSQETVHWCRVLTDPQFRAVRRALEQREGVNLISSPEVTTLSGRQAQIQVVDMRTVMSSTNGVLQTNTVPCGSVLDVLPTLGADGYTIQITAIPSLVEFLGYDDAGQFVPKVPVAPSATGSSPAPVSVMPLPRFRVRQVTKSAVLWDGQTLVIGGLSATNVMRLKDKVPVLGDLPVVGRAFRKKSVGTQTNTLLVFVTARLVDPAGNPIHRDDQMPFKPDSIPPQPPDPK